MSKKNREPEKAEKPIPTTAWMVWRLLDSVEENRKQLRAGLRDYKTAAVIERGHVSDNKTLDHIARENMRRRHDRNKQAAK